MLYTLGTRIRRSSVDDDDDDDEKKAITFNVPSSMGSFVDTMTIWELFYTTADDDDADDAFSEAINTTSSALSIINTALPLLFEDCIRACIRFLGAVSWSVEEEEKRVLSLIPLLKPEESHVLLARFLPVILKSSSDDEMLVSMILETVNPDHPNSAYSKAFVANFLRDFPSRKALRCALTRAFEVTLKVLNVSLKHYYSCPYFLTGEREKVERATSHARHVRWLIDMMIELRVGENAVKEWTDHNFLTDAVFKFFREKDHTALGIVAHVIGCTCKLATAVASGSILVDTQVRMKLVKDWLPVLIVSKENVLLPKKSKGEVLLPKKINNGKVLPIFAKDESMYRDLEKAFLRIISTLPMTDSQELLIQCIRLSAFNVEESPHLLSAFNVEESPHLLSAFNTWFSRAQTHQPEKFD